MHIKLCVTAATVAVAVAVAIVKRYSSYDTWYFSEFSRFAKCQIVFNTKTVTLVALAKLSKPNYSQRKKKQHSFTGSSFYFFFRGILNVLHYIAQHSHTMLYLLQRGKVRSQVINVPEGLPEVLSDIAREVLRCQPTTECLCQFIIDYMHSVIMSREKAFAAKSIIDRALSMVDEVITDLCLCHISKEKSEAMCAALEDCFQRFLAKRRCEQGKRQSILKFKEIDLLDELIMKCKFSESELKVSRPIIETAYEKFAEIYTAAQQNTEGTDALYQYFLEREQKRADERRRQSAALKIQAWYRGSHLRKSMYHDALQQAQEVSSESESEEMMLAKEMAARKIQQFFRNRLSSIHRKQSTVEFIEEICEYKSDVSLTMRPSGYVFQSEDEVEDQTVDETVPPTVPPKDIPEVKTPKKATVLMDSTKEIVGDDAKSA
uniref:Uncharacterized protein n=1 Tax=Glossina pallidipes TaxID=7398 RepID=A0A1B0GGP6_GLOPL